MCIFLRSVNLISEKDLRSRIMGRFSAMMAVCLLAGLSKGLTGDEGKEDAFQNFETTATPAAPEAGFNPPPYSVRKKLGSLEERLEAAIRAQEETNRRLEASEKKLSALENSVAHQGPPRIAFTAALTLSANLGPLNILHPLVYDHVLSNNGEHYSPVSGYFTAPVQGVYYFIFTSFSWKVDGTSTGGLYLNGNRMVSWHYSVQAGPLSGSNSAVLQLQAGDKVNVRLVANNMIGDNHNHYSTFSGFYLFPV